MRVLVIYTSLRGYLYGGCGKALFAANPVYAKLFFARENTHKVYAPTSFSEFLLRFELENTFK